MTDNEIVKALECCVSEQYTCGQCPFQEIKHYDDDYGFEIMPNGKRYDDWSCERWLNVALLDLINRLQAENDRLKREIEDLESVQEISPEAKYFVDTKADKVISLCNDCSYHSDKHFNKKSITLFDIITASLIALLLFLVWFVRL